MKRRSMMAWSFVSALGAAPARAAGPKKLVVGSKNFTEQLVLAAMTNEYLAANGYAIDLRTGLGTAALRAAQESGQIDLYWEYTGTSLITFNKVTEKLSPEETYARVRDLDAAKGLVWLTPSKANNTYALAMKRPTAAKYGLSSLSDMAAKINGGTTLKFASNAEFYARPDGLAPLEKTYGFQFGRENVVRMDTGLVYQALRDDQVDVGIVAATDGRIPAMDLLLLKDDKGYFPNYALTPVVRKDALAANPDIAGLMNRLSATFDDLVMAKLNAGVDVEKHNVEEVASAYLKAQKLV